MVELSRCDYDSCFQLARIINTDFLLRKALKINVLKTQEDVFDDIKKWEARKSGITYAIKKNNTVVGIISLSDQNARERRASIGYWISSNYWNMGFASAAVKEILNIASKIGLTSILAVCNVDNTASRRCLEKNGFCIEEKSEKEKYGIHLTIASS